MNDQTKQSEIIRTSLENIKSILDSNTVLGASIETEGGTIIPVSEVKVGLATGGIDYFGKRTLNDKNFGGGGGTGVTLTPLGMLVIDKFGKISLLSFSSSEKCFYNQIFDFIENSPELIRKFKALLEINRENQVDKP